MNTDDDGSFGYWVRRRRKALDLTQQALGTLVGCSLATVRKIERDERRPSRCLAQRLAETLDIGASERPYFLALAHHAQPGPVSWASMAATYGELGEAGELPALGPLIARDEELATAMRILLEPNTRLLNICGAPGVGKTHFAIELAARAGHSLSCAVQYVTLDTVAHADQLVQRLLRALSVPPQKGRPPLTTLIEALRRRELLLLLDGCEQLREATPVLSAILAHAPGLRVVATSRTALRLACEHVLVLPPLSRPEPYTTALALLAQNASVKVFVSFLCSVQPGFSLDPLNAPLVATICAQLDGIPLALRLAALRARYLPLKTICAALAEENPALTLSLLAEGPRDLPPRQQSMHAVFAWSFERLKEPQRALLLRLSAFEGAFQIDSLIGGESGISPDLLNDLAALYDEHLLLRQQQAGDEAPLQMLNLVRLFAREQVRQCAETLEIT